MHALSKLICQASKWPDLTYCFTNPLASCVLRRLVTEKFILEYFPFGFNTWQRSSMSFALPPVVIKLFVISSIRNTCFLKNCWLKKLNINYFYVITHQLKTLKNPIWNSVFSSLIIKSGILKIKNFHFTKFPFEINHWEVNDSTFGQTRERSFCHNRIFKGRKTATVPYNPLKVLQNKLHKNKKQGTL